MIQEIAILIPLFIAVAVLAHHFGVHTTRNPTEEEMLSRLVKMRTERLMTVVTEDKIRAEINKTSERIVKETTYGH